MLFFSSLVLTLLTAGKYNMGMEKLAQQKNMGQGVRQQASTKVTVPSEYELKQTAINYALSEYAMATGAAAVNQNKSVNGKMCYYGEAWTTTLADRRKLQAYGPDDMFNKFPTPRAHLPHTKSVAVAPRFQNPNAGGWSTVNIDGRDYLTKNGQLVYYPQSKVDGYTAVRLNAALQQRQCTPVNNLAYQQYYQWQAYYQQYYAQWQAYYQQYYQQYYRQYYAQAGQQNYAQNYVSNNYGYNPNHLAYYYYDNKNYALHCYNSYDNRGLVYDWYNCEPVQVARCADGSLQCRNLLFAAAYESWTTYAGLTSYMNAQNRDSYYAGAKARLLNIDPSKTALGQYLNQTFVQQLNSSLEFNKVAAKQQGQTMQEQQAQAQAQVQKQMKLSQMKVQSNQTKAASLADSMVVEPEKY